VVDNELEYQYNNTMFNAIEKILEGIANLFVFGFYLIWYAWMGVCAIIVYFMLQYILGF